MNATLKCLDEVPGEAVPLRNPQPVEEYLHYAATRDFHWNVPALESRRLNAQFLAQYEKNTGRLPTGRTPAPHPSLPDQSP